MLEERKATLDVFLAALQARADALEHKKEQEEATEPLPNPEPEAGPQPRLELAPATAPDLDEPPVYPILHVPHPPCACTSDSSASSLIPRYSQNDWCTAIQLRDSLQCMWFCIPGQRFCRIHCIAHGTIVVPHRVKEGMLEAQRMRVARAEGDRARRIADVKYYIEKLDEMEDIVKEHQRLFFCRCEDVHHFFLISVWDSRTHVPHVQHLRATWPSLRT